MIDEHERDPGDRAALLGYRSIVDIGLARCALVDTYRRRASALCPSEHLVSADDGQGSLAHDKRDSASS